MEKSFTFERTRFPAHVLKEAIESLRKRVPENSVARTLSMQAGANGKIWTHDNEEEFFADCRSSDEHIVFIEDFMAWRLSFMQFADSAVIKVSAPTRADVEAVFQVFESNSRANAIPEILDEEAPPVVFIGHGSSMLWRDLKDHLHEKHDYAVVAYEIGARAGHAVRDVLEEMLDRSSFALLVLTGDDETSSGSVRARQNVVHETGLFQGRLGFTRAIVLLEDNVEEFSNIQGITQIRFAKNRIKETFGDVLATLRREFPS
jgi:predicted nucleotide-binding protein